MPLESVVHNLYLYCDEQLYVFPCACTFDLYIAHGYQVAIKRYKLVYNPTLNLVYMYMYVYLQSGDMTR